MCSRSGVILCVSGTLCIQGLPALFIPDSFVLVLSVTLFATPHMLLAHQIIPANAQAKAMKLLMYLFKWPVCCFRKQCAIHSFLEWLIYQGSAT